MEKSGHPQTPAGRVNIIAPKIVGKRSMAANNTAVKTTCMIDNVPYKGNAVLNANRG